MKKAFASLLCAALLIIPGMPSAHATESSSIQNNLTATPSEELTNLSMHEYTVLSDGAVITRISASEYESAAKSDLTVNEGKLLTKQMASPKAGGVTTYYDYVRTFRLNQNSDLFKADLHAKIKVYIDNNSGYGQIEAVEGVYSTPTPGAALCTWTQTLGGFSALNGKFPCGRVELFADGFYTINTQITTGVDVSVLPSLGFSVSASSSTIWTSRVQHMYGGYQTF